MFPTEEDQDSTTENDQDNIFIYFNFFKKEFIVIIIDK